MPYVKVPSQYLEDLVRRANRPVPETDNRPWREIEAEANERRTLEVKVAQLRRDREVWAKTIEMIEGGLDLFKPKVTRLDVMRDALRFFDAALAAEYVPVTYSTSHEYLNVSGPGEDVDVTSTFHYSWEEEG